MLEGLAKACHPAAKAQASARRYCWSSARARAAGGVPAGAKLLLSCGPSSLLWGRAAASVQGGGACCAMKACPKGTATRKGWEGEMHGGRAASYDGKGKYYKISYVDGDSEEMTHQEAKQHCKPSQELSRRKPSQQGNA